MLLASVVGLGGCGPQAPEAPVVDEPDFVASGRSNAPAADVDPLRDPSTPFTFRVVDANWELHEDTVITVDSARATATLEFPRIDGAAIRRFRTTTPIDVARLDELRGRLLASFRPLAPDYHDRARMFDGAQTTFELAVGGQVQRVHCSNAMPPELIALGRFVRDRLLGPDVEDRAEEVARTAAQDGSPAR